MTERFGIYQTTLWFYNMCAGGAHCMYARLVMHSFHHSAEAISGIGRVSNLDICGSFTINDYATAANLQWLDQLTMASIFCVQQT